MEPTGAAGRDRIPGAAEEPDSLFPGLLRACATSAVHLEMRDGYTPDDPWFLAWLAGDREDFQRRLTRPWLELIREVTARGVQVRRARVVSEPVSDYIRFEQRQPIRMPSRARISAGCHGTWRPGCCCPPTTTGCSMASGHCQLLLRTGQVPEHPAER